MMHVDKTTEKADEQPEELNEQIFIDDKSVIHSHRHDLQKHAITLNKICLNFGMKISTTKIEIMQVSQIPGQLHIQMKDKSWNKELSSL